MCVCVPQADMGFEASTVMLVATPEEVCLDSQGCLVNNKKCVCVCVSLSLCLCVFESVWLCLHMRMFVLRRLLAPAS